jgi:regulation of enolase protein 1 (concanavalin A-like superfamily)
LRLLSSFPFVLLGLALSVPAFAAQTQLPANQDAPPSLDGVPGPLIWQHPPARWRIDNRQTLAITADKATDWFVSPVAGRGRDNAPRLLFKPANDFVLSAKVTVDFHSQRDSGVLILYVNDAVWAKLCFEMSAEMHPAIVSVVAKEASDDNSSIPISGNSVYLKMAKAGQAVFFYASENGQSWSVVRAFSLGKSPNLRVGFSSQSPAGDGCTSVFSQIQYLPEKVNLWSGK